MFNHGRTERSSGPAATTLGLICHQTVDKLRNDHRNAVAGLPIDFTTRKDESLSGTAAG